MPTKHAAKEKTRAEYEAEIKAIEICCEDAVNAYTLLREACDNAMACRDIVLRDGTMKNMLAVYACLERAIMEADKLHVIAYDEDRMLQGHIWCSVCETFLSTEDEKKGHCLVCFHSGVL